jgi:hypothetical protein
MTSSWRQIFQGPEIECCNALKLGRTFRFYEQADKFSKLFINNSFVCPLQPGPYYVMNNMNNISESSVNSTERSGFGIELPNGLYRFTIKTSTKADPVGGLLQWQTEIRNKLGDENF